MLSSTSTIVRSGQQDRIVLEQRFARAVDESEVAIAKDVQPLQQRGIERGLRGRLWIFCGKVAVQPISEEQLIREDAAFII